MAKEYTTKTKVADFLNETISLTDNKFNNFIKATEKWIDRYTGRNFKADSSTSVRYYNGNDKSILEIDDCVSVSKVEVGSDFYGDSHTEITISGSDRYYTLPRNNVNEVDANTNEEKLPIDRIWLRARYWIRGIGNHKITAKWGYSSTPPSDIQWVATYLTGSIYKQGRGGNLGGVKSERIGEYNVTFHSEKDLQDFEKAKEILEKYKIYNL